MSKRKTVKRVLKKVSATNGRLSWRPGPIKGSFMALSIIGFFITVYLVNDINWKTAFILVFMAMFIASIISMTVNPIKDQY
ncbi:MAG: hypothetical protein V2A62_04450 [Candidatus Woesearchaeota archaeon]